MLRPGPAPAPRWTYFALAAGALCFLVILAYSNSLSNGFVWDDTEQIVMNPDLRPGASWAKLFSSDVWSYKHRDQPARTNYYRPLQMVSYRVASELFGSGPRPLHVLNIAFALAAALAAFAGYWKLTRRLALAFAAAALFAVHPAHSEAVDWISALPEIGCAAFVLIAFALFLSARRGEGARATATGSSARRWIFAGLSLLLFALALLWKETAVVFPLLIATQVFCAESEGFVHRLRSSVRLSLPFWVVLVAYLALRFRILGFLSTRQRIWDLTPFQVALSDLHLLAVYWWKLLVPFPLNAYYVFAPVRSIFEVHAIIGILFAVVACAALWYALRRAPLAAFATFWTFITLLPAMNIYALGRNVFTERYLYLASFGFCLLVALVGSWAVQRLPGRLQQPISALVLATVIIGFGVQTFARNSDWRSDATLFQETLLISPDAPFVHYMVASSESDDPATAASAEAHYLQTIQLAENEQPPDLLDISRACQGLAVFYTNRGDYDHALETLHKWRSIIPAQPEMDAEEGSVLLHLGRWQEAEPFLNRAASARPQDENILNSFGILAWEYKRNLDDAAAMFTRALAIHTQNDGFQASLHNNLGGVYGDMHRFPQALEQFQAAVAIEPADSEYRTNLATAFAAMNHYQDAIEQAQSALRINPNFAPARALLDQLNARASGRQ